MKYEFIISIAPSSSVLLTNLLAYLFLSLKFERQESKSSYFHLKKQYTFNAIVGTCQLSKGDIVKLDDTSSYFSVGNGIFSFFTVDATQYIGSKPHVKKVKINVRKYKNNVDFSKFIGFPASPVVCMIFVRI